LPPLPSKIVGRSDFSGQEASSPDRFGRRCIERGYSHQRFAGFGDDEGFAIERLIDQLGEASPGLLDVDGLYSTAPC
jgi:hypothetical protein